MEAVTKQKGNGTVFLVAESYSYGNDLKIKSFRTYEDAEQYIQNQVKKEIRIANEKKEIPTEHIEAKPDNGWHPMQTDLMEYTWDNLGNPVRDVITWRIVEMTEKELIPDRDGITEEKNYDKEKSHQTLL